jgi:putative DNA primase/helicase
MISLNERQEEGDKQLGALLLEGPPIISLDNLMHDLGGALLNQMTEHPSVKDTCIG